MKVVLYSHQGAKDRVPSSLQAELVSRLRALHLPVRRGALTKARTRIRSVCTDLGFSGKLRLHRDSRISVSGVRGRTGLCLQTGNVARVYADLLKLQLLFSRGDIHAAVMVVMLNSAATTLGQNLANYERLIRELGIFADVITTPILVLGLEGD